MIVFRCDSSNKIGNGHVKRCLFLAKELKKIGEQCIFFTINYSGNSINEIKSQGFDIKIIPKNTKTTSKKNEVFDIEYDAQQTINLLSGIKPKLFVVDNYQLDINWEIIIKKHCYKLMVIDDLANRSHKCDIFLDHNLKENIADAYRFLIPNNCIKLFGPKYALVDLALNTTQKSIKIKTGKVQNILVSFSKGDLEGMTLKLLKAFISIREKEINIFFIVNNESPYYDQIKKIANKYCNIKILDYQKSLLPLMLKSDYAFGGGGVSCLERCCLGISSSVICLSKNQEELINTLSKKNLIRNLGDYKKITIKKLKDELYFVKNLKLDKKNSKDCMKILDGLGSKRVAEFILRETKLIKIKT